jgi:esterase/lipase superfamily enzyme
MMKMNYLQVQTALKAVWNELPAMLGERMNEFETQLLPLLREIEAEPFDSDRVDAVLTLLENEYPQVYERMLEAESERARKSDVAFRSTTKAVKPTVGRYIIVPVWYATDRKNTGKQDPGERYSGERGTLQFGRVEVSIPDSHDKGKLEKPSLFRLQFREDPEKHIVLLTLEQVEAAAWTTELKQKLAVCSKRDVLLFIHGYNVGFEDAARRAAQFQKDLEFQGLTVLYSWPAEGKVRKYMVDEDNVLWTVDDFEEVLCTLMTETGAERVHAVGHSMGSRVLTEGIRRMDPAALPATAAKLRDVVFAAPDINADTFRKFVEKFYRRAERFTLYASNADKAMGISQRLHRYPRAGDTRDGVVLSAGLETIDASAVDKDFMGHSYFCENRIILQDMFNLIMEGKSEGAPRYGLNECKTPQGSYWALLR